MKQEFNRDSKGMWSILTEFKPSLLFLSKFLFIYFIGNLLYGIYVESYGNQADGITWWVSGQSATVLAIFGYETGTASIDAEPKVSLQESGDGVINVFEGCNGINIMILFVAFIIAFKGPVKNTIVFILIGASVIHIANLGRIGLLYWVALEKPDFMYFTHKYVFTAIIYSVVFLLWVFWITKFGRRSQIKPEITTEQN